MNTFMNYVNRFLAGEGTRGGLGASGRVGASLLPAFDLPGAPASLFCSIGLTKRLTQGLRRVVRDLGAIAKEEEKDQKRDSSE